MEMNFMEKVMTVLKYMISSFMNIEILLIVLLFFTILFYASFFDRFKRM